MSDVVVTVPMKRWDEWLAEGDLADDCRVECQECGWTGDRAAWQLHPPLRPHRSRATGDALRVCRAAYTEQPEWAFTVGGGRPGIEPGERVYVIAHGRLRGYAPLVRVHSLGNRHDLIRCAGAVAVTIPPDSPVAPTLKGFQGWRYRWWRRSIEVPFPDWRAP